VEEENNYEEREEYIQTKSIANVETGKDHQVLAVESRTRQTIYWRVDI